MRLRLTTWNINSVRLRIDLVTGLLERLQPDVICLQETKVPDPLFPLKPFHKLGYAHHVIAGQKGYHGVAILSRRPFEASERRNWCGKEDARHVHATLEGGIELHNFYVPSGGDVPDPAVNDKFAHKLMFLDEVAGWFSGRCHPEGRMVMVGDLNVAPSEFDVWSHKQLLDVVSHTPVEVEKLTAIYDTGWVDAVRAFHPEPEKLYSWWSYRARDWRASNRGRRLDHIWVTPALKPALRGVQILDEARDWEKCSDHVPVTVDLEV
ncbi:MAG: exodeoxyribonuclease III [Alphaproteobacteria bacterium]|nr:exodeoxyribonuclease III [Alphaproteobacteria bacterium]